MQGVVAAGQEHTAQAAWEVLEDGGNAFDAALAAMCMTAVAEPVLSSFGGGGFLMAAPAEGTPVCFDFFAETPGSPLPKEGADFRPIVADFGPAQQEFHVGLGTMAVPGLVDGLFRVHGRLGSLPLPRLLEPACRLAREGFRLSAFQAHLFSVVRPIYLATEGARTIFAAPGTDQLLGEGELFRNPEQADFLEVLAKEGRDLFYRGEVARTITGACRDGGGALTPADFEAYSTHERAPLKEKVGPWQVWLNPPPSAGGVLVAATVRAFLAQAKATGPASVDAFDALADAMAQANRMRETHSPEEIAAVLAGASNEEGGAVSPQVSRGTTHISVVDHAGNAAALTLSNGEGAGWVVPGTGIMMNNMLGEEDINPWGLGTWPPGRRMGSMMSPTVARGEDGVIALGSGGSNRIRSAVFRVLTNMLVHGCTPEEAVALPRLHLEGTGTAEAPLRLDMEPGFDAEAEDRAAGRFPGHRVWPEPNLFFGGVHVAASLTSPGRCGAGDPRRAGVVRIT